MYIDSLQFVGIAATHFTYLMLKCIFSDVIRSEEC